MGLLEILGNASGISIDEIENKFNHIFLSDETIYLAYKLFRDYIVFTSKRLLLIDIQGISGKKIEFLSIPYKSIVAFAVETPGTLDSNGELKLYLKGSIAPLKLRFHYNKVNIFEIQSVLTEIILNDDEPNGNNFPNNISSENKKNNYSNQNNEVAKNNSINNLPLKERKERKNNICKSCNKPISPNTNFCIHCGAKL
ncbi:PH domain-containing protein [Methanobrevibacter sp. DSM 116169]|uniref:PH domain-containing protein n=1 Tax=Methanobrevibacter sp. DSM 116169 TaxID=3242727 RepID=UPI0038FC68FA